MAPRLSGREIDLTLAAMQEREIYHGRRIQVIELRRSVADMDSAPKEVIRHPGSVVIVPLIDRNNVCLIKNYRIAVDQVLVELPAGTLESGENPDETAQRELAEETGFQVGTFERLASFYAAPGVLDERMHLYLATELTSGTPKREAGEEIENLIVSWSDAMAMVEDGTIQDAKTIVGLLMVNQRRQANSLVE